MCIKGILWEFDPQKVGILQLSVLLCTLQFCFSSVFSWQSSTTYIKIPSFINIRITKATTWSAKTMG